MTLSTVAPIRRATSNDTEGYKGQVRIKITKDRPGVLRAHTDATEQIALMNTLSYPDGRLNISIDPPTGASADTTMQRAILGFLRQHPAGMNKGNIETNVDGKADRIRATLDELERLGQIEVDRTGRGHLCKITEKGRIWFNTSL